MRRTPVGFVLVVALVVGCLSWADGTITDGDATVSFTAIPTSPLDAPAAVVFRPAGAEPSTNRIWFSYRIEGDTREYAAVPISESYSASSATFDAQTADFEATVGFVVIDWWVPGEAGLQYDFTVTNPAGASGDLLIHLYLYVDIDLPPDPGDEQARIAQTPWGEVAEVFDGDPGRRAQCQANPTYRQAGDWAALMNLLTDDQVFIPDGSGFPFGPGDFAYVEMVSFILSPGDTNVHRGSVRLVHTIFADDFETGNLDLWSATVP